MQNNNNDNYEAQLSMEIGRLYELSKNGLSSEQIISLLDQIKEFVIKHDEMLKQIADPDRLEGFGTESEEEKLNGERIIERSNNSGNLKGFGSM